MTAEFISLNRSFNLLFGPIVILQNLIREILTMQLCNYMSELYNH